MRIPTDAPSPTGLRRVVGLFGSRGTRPSISALTVAGCWLAGYAAFNWVSRDPALVPRPLATAVYLVPVAGAALAALRAAVLRRGRNRTGLAWIWFAVSTLLWLAGELIWAVQGLGGPDEVPYPSVADGFYLLGYLAAARGLHLGFGQGHRSAASRLALDLFLVGLGLGALAWHLLIAAQLTGTHGLARLVTAAYPLSDVAILVCLLTVGLSGHRRLPGSVRAAGWAYLIAAVTDCWYMYGTLHGQAYGDGNALNVSYQLANVLLVLAAARAAAGTELDAIRLAVGRDLTVVPLVVAGAAALLALVLTRPPTDRFDGFVAVAGAVVAGLMVRQYLVTRDRSRLADQLTAALREQERLAVTDSLTGLPNRRFFQNALSTLAAVATRSGRPLGLVVCDLDRFKTINDTYGHDVGDVALAETAARLRAVTRDGDVVARIGGEEFVWLLPDTDEDGAFVLAERLRQALRASPIPLRDGPSLRVTASLGVSSVRGTIDQHELLRSADQAMYRAKAAGRDRIERASAADVPRGPAAPVTR